MLPPDSRGGVDVSGSEAATAAASISKEAAGTSGACRNAEVRVLQIRTSTRTIHCAMQCGQLLVSLM